MQTFIRASWLTVLIAVTIRLLTCNKLSQRSDTLASSLVLRGKRSLELRLGVFLPNLRDHIFQSMNPETFLLNRITSACNVKRSSILLENSISWDFQPLTGGSVYHLIVIDYSDCFIDKLILNYNTVGVHSTSDCYIFANDSLFSCHKYECSEWSHILRSERYIYQKNRSGVRNRNRTTLFPYAIETRLFVERSLVFVTDLHLIPCTKSCELAFSGWSEWRSGQFLKLHQLYSGTLLGAGESNVWLLAQSARNLEASLNQICFQHFTDCKDFRPIWGNWCLLEWSFSILFESSSLQRLSTAFERRRSHIDYFMN